MYYFFFAARYTLQWFFSEKNYRIDLNMKHTKQLLHFLSYRQLMSFLVNAINCLLFSTLKEAFPCSKCTEMLMLSERSKKMQNELINSSNTKLKMMNQWNKKNAGCSLKIKKKTQIVDPVK